MAICSPASSPLIAEALALREAVALAANLDLSDVIFESDSLSLIKNWVARKGNYVADLLAHLASTKDLPPDWIWNPPPRLKQALDRDSSCLRQVPVEVSGEVAESSMSIGYSDGGRGDFPLHGGSMHLNPSLNRVFASLLKPWVQPRIDGVG